jgi:signal transduction histidine kinase
MQAPWRRLGTYFLRLRSAAPGASRVRRRLSQPRSPLGPAFTRQLWLIRIGSVLMTLDLLLVVYILQEPEARLPALAQRDELFAWLQFFAGLCLVLAGLLLAIHYTRTLSRLQRLAMQVRVLEEFTGTLQDRLGQPLTAARLYARLLAEQEPLTDRGKHYCAGIEQAVDEAVQLLAGFLDPGRLINEAAQDRAAARRNRALLEQGSSCPGPAGSEVRAGD